MKEDREDSPSGLIDECCWTSGHQWTLGRTALTPGHEIFESKLRCKQNEVNTVAILKFALGVWNLIYAKFFDSTQNREKLILFLRFFPCGIQFCRAVFGTLSQNVFYFCGFFCVWPNFFAGLWFIHFGATAKDQGYLELWDCSPFRTSPVLSELAPLSALGHSKHKSQMKPS